MTYNKLRSAGLLVMLALPLTTMLSTGCKKDNAGKKSDPPASFIPQKNKKFIYSVETDGKTEAMATVSILGTSDSAGITIYNQRSIVENFDGQFIVLDNKLFSLKGKTYNEIKVPEAWYTIVAMFNSMPKVSVKKTEVFGYPAYMTMENALKDGAIAIVDGPLIQGQRVEYTNDGKAASMQQEILQVGGPGKVETIEVPAGSFTCNKFSYETDTKITSNNGESEYTGNGSEKVTVWMAHGIGVVKQESASRLVTLVPLPTGEIKEVITNTTSVTTLEEIN